MYPFGHNVMQNPCQTPAVKAILCVIVNDLQPMGGFTRFHCIRPS